MIHAKAGLDTYVELLQASSSVTTTGNNKDVEVDVMGMKCNCKFAKREEVVEEKCNDDETFEEKISRALIDALSAKEKADKEDEENNQVQY